MIDSIRRITLGVMFVLLMTFTASASQSVSSGCDKGISCLAAAAFSSFDMNLPLAGSTAQKIPQTHIDFDLLVATVRVVSLYGLLVSILTLLILESYKPHYLKNFFRRRYVAVRLKSR